MTSIASTREWGGGVRNCLQVVELFTLSVTFITAFYICGVLKGLATSIQIFEQLSPRQKERANIVMYIVFVQTVQRVANNNKIVDNITKMINNQKFTI